MKYYNFLNNFNVWDYRLLCGKPWLQSELKYSYNVYKAEEKYMSLNQDVLKTIFSSNFTLTALYLIRETLPHLLLSWSVFSYPNKTLVLFRR